MLRSSRQAEASPAGLQESTGRASPDDLNGRWSDPGAANGRAEENSGGIRVLLACDRLGYDGNRRLHGAGRLMIDWTRSLVAKGVDVTTVILREPGTVGRELQEEGLPFVFLDRHQYDPRTLMDFVELIRERRIDVLHLQAFGASTFGRVAAALTGKPCIVHVHADYRGEPKGYPWYVRALDHLLAPLTERVIAISEAVKRFAVEHQGFQERQVRVFHSPVDLEDFRVPSSRERAERRRALEMDPEAPVAVCVGRFHPIKGIDLLVSAWRDVVESIPTARLLLVGDGPMRDELERRVAELDLGASIRFLGYREDVRAVLWAADVAVVPSRDEGLGLAAIEAMACGLPVVATRVGGLPELVRDGENGLLVEPEDPDALSAGIRQLLDSSQTAYAAMRERASDSADGRDLDSYATTLLEQYRSVVEGRA